MKKEIDYVELFAKKLKEDNSLFRQQKMLIESQMQASRSLFQNMFKDDFKKEARDYLKEVGAL